MTLFAKLSLGVSQHPRFIEAGPAAAGYWMAALDWLRSTSSRDGVLTAAILPTFYGLGRDKALRLCSILVRVGLFADLGDGRFELLRYAVHNETRDAIEQRRAEDAERKRAARAKSHRAPPYSPQEALFPGPSPQSKSIPPPDSGPRPIGRPPTRPAGVPGSGSGSEEGSAEGGEPRSMPPPTSAVRPRFVKAGRDTPPEEELDWAARAMAAAEFGASGGSP